MENNLKHLRKIIAELSNGPIGEDPKQELLDEAEEFVDSIEEELSESRDKITRLEEELADVNSTIQNMKDDEINLVNSVDLGLDTLHFSLEQGNLRIQSQLEQWINAVKKQNCAGVLAIGELF